MNDLLDVTLQIHIIIGAQGFFQGSIGGQRLAVGGLRKASRSMSEPSGSMKAQNRTSRYPKLKKLKRKGEREWLAMSEDGSEIETKRAGGFWVSIYNWVYNWALG